MVSLQDVVRPGFMLSSRCAPQGSAAVVDPLRCNTRRDRTGLDAPLCGGDNGGLTVGDTTVLDMMDVEKEHEQGRGDLNSETECRPS